MNKPLTPPGVVQSDSRVLNYFTRIIVCLIALGAAVLSFDALTILASASGIRPEFSWIWAIVIDGFIMVATFATFALKDRTGFSKYYAWVTLAVFVIFSILGNAWHAAIEQETFILPLWVAVTVTAIPPLALFLAIHLLIIMVSPTPEQKEEHKREVEKRERVYRLQRKELERIEELAAINEVRVNSGLEPLDNLPGTRPKKPPVSSSVTTKKPATATSPSKPSITETRPQIAVPADNAPESHESVNRANTQPVPEVITANVEQETQFLSEEEITNLLLTKITNEEPLPTGKAISEMLGKSERTGQNFLKKFKNDNNLI